MEPAAARGHFDDSLGIWVSIRRKAAAVRCPALFLDRDGVIVEETRYLSRSADVALIPGAAETIAQANRFDIPVIAVTNQAGIARGYYGWEEFLEVEDAIAEQLERAGAALDAVFACPYHRDGIEPWIHPAHPGRKPRPGMLLAAGELLNIDLGRSWMVGDKVCDMEAGRNAGLCGGLHVLTGHGGEERSRVEALPAGLFTIRYGHSIRDAATFLHALVNV